MNSFLTYIFWPNPGNATYQSPKALALMLFCFLLIALSFVVRMWRNKKATSSFKRISKSWPSAMFWFGLVGLVLIVSRVEQIQFIAMRFLWVLWILAALAYIALQIRVYRTSYYEVLPTITVEDPRSKYLPKRKKK